MEAYIEITIGNLNADTNRIIEEAEGILKELRQFQEELSQLAAMWEGPAHQEYERQTNRNLQKIGDICKLLRVYTDNMQYAGREYEKCERSVTGLIDKIRI